MADDCTEALILESFLSAVRQGILTPEGRATAVAALASADAAANATARRSPPSSARHAAPPAYPLSIAYILDAPPPESVDALARAPVSPPVSGPSPASVHASVPTRRTTLDIVSLPTKSLETAYVHKEVAECAFDVLDVELFEARAGTKEFHDALSTALQVWNIKYNASPRGSRVRVNTAYRMYLFFCLHILLGHLDKHLDNVIRADVRDKRTGLLNHLPEDIAKHLKQNRDHARKCFYLLRDQGFSFFLRLDAPTLKDIYAFPANQMRSIQDRVDGVGKEGEM